jgi:2-polyprenyl-3-methyl-5-hydroxy-6-metoxy-1,4-benzoquinol methylase
MKIPTKKYQYTIPSEGDHVALKILAAVPPESRVLEIGCSSGSQTRLLKNSLGCTVTGIEIDAAAAEDAREFCERLIIGDIENINLTEVIGNWSFDAIILSDVLEHLKQPGDTLVKLRPFLGQTGILLASIPNIAHAAICWELAHGRFDYRDYGLLDDTHIRFFTKKSITHLFEASGYYVAAWERIIKRPQETEFEVRPLSAGDNAFLDWIEAQNPEADTFQFVVRAHSTEQRGMFESDMQKVQAEINTARVEIEQLKQHNQQLASQIQWLEGHRFGGLTRLSESLRRWLWSTKKR